MVGYAYACTNFRARRAVVCSKRPPSACSTEHAAGRWKHRANGDAWQLYMLSFDDTNMHAYPAIPCTPISKFKRKGEEETWAYQ